MKHWTPYLARQLVNSSSLGLVSQASPSPPPLELGKNVFLVLGIGISSILKHILFIVFIKVVKVVKVITKVFIIIDGVPIVVTTVLLTSLLPICRL